MNNNIEKVRYLVAGAGVSGLAFANFIKGNDYLVLEKEEEAGGYCRSVHQDGFTWDYSGHFFHFRDPAMKRFIEKRLAPGSLLTVNKNATIHYKGSSVNFPFQKNIHQLPLNEFLECLHDLYFRNVKKKPKNFLEMVYSNYGKAIAEKFLVPYNEKLYACKLNALDVECMGRFFPAATLDEIIRNFISAGDSSYNSRFTYPKGGAEQYIEALLQGVKKENISFKEYLTGVDMKKKVASTNKRKIRFERLITSIPFPALLKACKIKVPGKVLSSNKVLALNLGFNKGTTFKQHWIYFPEKKYSFYRVGFYNNIHGDERMSLYVEVGMGSGTIPDVDVELKKSLQGLREAGIITDQELISHHSVLMDPAYVHINRASEDLWKRSNKELLRYGIHSIGRYGGWKYCAIEDNMLEARTLASKLNSKR